MKTEAFKSGKTLSDFDREIIEKEFKTKLNKEKGSFATPFSL